MKKLLPLLAALAFAAPSFAQKARPISDQRAIILMNYLQYSLSQVRQNQSLLVASNEFDAIINNINPTTLKDDQIIEAYNGILSTMTELKLLDNKRKHAEEMAERERKAAITSILSSPGSIFVPGQNPALSIAYAALSAGLNYAGARAQINDKKLETEFQIAQDTLKTIDNERRELYTRGAKVFRTRNDTNDLIPENTMDAFIKAVNNDDASTRKVQLESQRTNLALFPPYWYALGYVQQELELYKEALDSYSRYEALLQHESVLRFDEMLCQIQFAKIDIYKLQKKALASKEIQAAIQTVKNEIPKATPEKQAQQKFALAIMYRSFGDNDSYERTIAEAEELGSSTWNKSIADFKAAFAEAVEKEKENIVLFYADCIQDEYNQALDDVKQYVRSIRFSSSAQGGLSVDASAIPVKLTLERVADGDDEVVTLKPSAKNSWQNVLTHEERRNAKSFLTDTLAIFFWPVAIAKELRNAKSFLTGRYCYLHLQCDDFSILLHVGYGLGVSDDVANVRITKAGEKDMKIKIGYECVQLRALPTFSDCLKKDKDFRDTMQLVELLYGGEIKTLQKALQKSKPLCFVFSTKSIFYPDSNNEDLYWTFKPPYFKALKK